ncbi:uncharacterized protein EI90DRAFT_3075875 [Cantharellus anzutake]|uniref:uncharacterized protein n=1 Tax=Cantharellus anzutake TaxID=1750568 RepID=UPI0019035469|nr:uncharacterized protein EI90DRAFT_3075875 [Cantharellus anzutake]KAF8324329.1 hypothetical protein EI90DRAFT_3075875 [Cantharellus anzutake]
MVCTYFSCKGSCIVKPLVRGTFQQSLSTAALVKIGLRVIIDLDFHQSFFHFCSTHTHSIVQIREHRIGHSTFAAYNPTLGTLSLCHCRTMLSYEKSIEGLEANDLKGDWDIGSDRRVQGSIGHYMLTGWESHRSYRKNVFLASMHEAIFGNGCGGDKSVERSPLSFTPFQMDNQVRIYYLLTEASILVFLQ